MYMFAREEIMEILDKFTRFDPISIKRMNVIPALNNLTFSNSLSSNFVGFCDSALQSIER